MTEHSDVLRRASAEIVHLRRRNEVLQAKVDTMGCSASARTSQSSGCPSAIWIRCSLGVAIDVAWELDRLADEIEAGPVAEGPHVDG